MMIKAFSRYDSSLQKKIYIIKINDLSYRFGSEDEQMIFLHHVCSNYKSSIESLTTNGYKKKYGI